MAATYLLEGGLRFLDLPALVPSPAVPLGSILTFLSIPLEVGTSP
jgi:hypothetical protein